MDQLIHLILHQRNQRRDHYGQPVDKQRRHLKGDGFSASGGHQAKRVVSVQNRPYNLGLHRTERIVAPVLFEHAEHRRHYIAG